MNHTDYQNRLDEILETVFMAGLGISGADDIDPDEKDTAILNTQKHYVTQAKLALTKLTEEVVDEVIGKDEPLPEKTFQGDDNIADYFCSECYFAVDTCSHETENDLRSDQRTTKTKLLKGEL